MLDATDKKVLAALFHNARAPISVIAREQGLTREVVEYRIAKLVQEQVITGFIARINQVYFCAGVAQIRVKLVRTELAGFEKIVTAVRNHSAVNWAAELCGDADIIMTVFFSDSEDLAKTTDELMSIMGDLVREKDISLYITEYKFDTLGLVKEDTVAAATAVTFGGKQDIDLDEKDLILLSELARNCRSTAVELAKKIGLSEDAVRQRIKVLEKQQVILGYTILLNAAACGYELYYMRFLVEQFTPEVSSKLSYYARTNPYITYCCHRLGNYNVVMSIAARDHKHFFAILLDIRKHFGELLTDYEFQIIVRDLKAVFVPEQFIGRSG